MAARREFVRRLAFARWPDENHQDIFTVATNGRDLRRITSTGHAFAPAWSPDSRTIAFSDDGQLATAPSSGGKLRVLGGDLTQNCSGADWSPDASRLAASCNGRLVVLTVADSRIRALSTGAESAPSWSPDGTLIVYQPRSQLHVIRADGGTPTLINLRGAKDRDPDWSG